MKVNKNGLANPCCNAMQRLESIESKRIEGALVQSPTKGFSGLLIGHQLDCGFWAICFDY
jgi:hypothetical protein